MGIGKTGGNRAMTKKLCIIGMAVMMSLNVTACASLLTDVEKKQYDINQDDYSSMKDGGEYYNPVDESAEYGEGLDNVKASAYNKNKGIVESEDAVEESKVAASEAAVKASEEAVIAASKAAETKASSAGGSGSSGQGAGSSFQGLSSGNLSITAGGNVRDKSLGEVRTIIRDGGGGSNISSNTSSGGSTDKDIARKNVASIKKSGKLYDSYITVESCYKGSQALRRVNTYNSHHAVEYDLDIPNGYELCVVTFTVEPSSALGNNSSGVYIPKTIIRQGSGSSFGEYSIMGHVLQLSLEDYDSDDKSSTKNNLTYDLVFEIPEDTASYSVIFGESTGSTYRFKSTSLD